jgi:hypothetical protein
MKGSGHGLILSTITIATCLKGLRKTTKNLGQDNRSRGLDLK